jgi:hypothetical protein
MRKALLVSAVFMFASSLWGADPWIGTWKANLGKSKIPGGAGANLSEMTAVFKDLDADTYELSATATMKDGSTVPVYTLTIPKRGGNQVYKQGGPGQGISVITTYVDTYTQYNTYVQNGKQVGLMRVTMSKDGKTYTAVQTGADAQGKSTETTVVWEKQ